MHIYLHIGVGKLVGVNLRYVSNNATHELKMQVDDEIRNRKESLTFLLMLQKVCWFSYPFHGHSYELFFCLLATTLHVFYPRRYILFS